LHGRLLFTGHLVATEASFSAARINSSERAANEPKARRAQFRAPLIIERLPIKNARSGEVNDPIGRRMG
jgi:hypothetical protein